jgi:ornithine cyclodeaminase/alanine dehydrogenase-like protein (mu-crystallin family)
MYGAGQLRGPDGDRFPGAVSDMSAPDVATLGQIVVGRRPGRRSPDDVTPCNPSGMAVLNVALGAAIAGVAAEKGLGLSIPR